MMQVTVKTWSGLVGEDKIQTYEKTFNTKRSFEQLVNDPVVADKVLELIQENDWDIHQHIVRIPSKIAQKHGLSTWKNHTSVRIDPNHTSKHTVRIVEEYDGHESISPPGKGNVKQVNVEIPKTDMRFYTGQNPSIPECWNCGDVLRNGEDDRVITLSERYFSDESTMPDSYPYPSRIEYVCDKCAIALLTPEDVDEYGHICDVCEQLKGTALKRLIVPHGASPSESPSAIICGSCVERESLEALIRKSKNNMSNMVKLAEEQKHNS